MSWLVSLLEGIAMSAMRIAERLQKPPVMKEPKESARDGFVRHIDEARKKRAASN